MNLSQPEIIQILRRRANLSQGEFGEKAFNTSFESGRSKIKKIELGKQIPTDRDLKRMATVLGVPKSSLKPDEGTPVQSSAGTEMDGIQVNRKVLDRFPHLMDYLSMLNKAAIMDDLELIDYLAEKISGLLIHDRVDHKVASN